MEVPFVNVGGQVLDVVTQWKSMEEPFTRDVGLDGASHGVIVETAKEFKSIFFTKGHRVT